METKRIFDVVAALKWNFRETRRRFDRRFRLQQSSLIEYLIVFCDHELHQVAVDNVKNTFQLGNFVLKLSTFYAIFHSILVLCFYVLCKLERSLKTQ